MKRMSVILSIETDGKSSCGSIDGDIRVQYLRPMSGAVIYGGQGTLR